MLVISRKPGTAVQIGPDIKVHVVEVEGGKVRLGIEAPRDVAVLRDDAVIVVPKGTIVAEGKSHE